VVQDFAVIDDLVEFRKKINDGREKRISFQPFFMKAMAAAIKKYPIVNATYDPEEKQVVLHKPVNIGLAVNTDDGLMVPVIKNVESKSIQEINEEMKELATQAKDRKITLDDLRGGTITITNYGPFGGVYGRPMIMPPQVAIIGFGRIHQKPVVNDGEIVPGYVLPVSMTCDHRVVDGAPGSSFLTYFLELIGDIEKLLIAI
jgi:pyruvate dehydrogenase E2 component (dihydrolipoamide acetyltransferase)